MKRYVVFDLEATCEKGDKKYPHEIIELVAVDNFGNTFQEYIKPIQEPILTDFCKELTGIKQKDVDNARSFKEIIKDFWLFCDVYSIEDSLTFVYWGKGYHRNKLIGDLLLNDLRDDIDFLTNCVSVRELYELKTNRTPIDKRIAFKQENIPFDKNKRSLSEVQSLKKLYDKLKKEGL